MYNLGKLPSRVRQGVEIMLASASRLDQAAVAQQRKVVADGGLALGPEIGAELSDVSLPLAEQHEHLQTSRIGDLLQ